MSCRCAISMQISARSSGRALSARALRSASDSSLAAAKIVEARTIASNATFSQRIGLVLLGLDRDKAMPSLPFLVRILSVRRIKETMIVDGRPLVIAQMIISGGAEEKANRRHLGV